jgi:hypothetical protein
MKSGIKNVLAYYILGGISVVASVAFLAYYWAIPMAEAISTWVQASQSNW